MTNNIGRVRVNVNELMKDMKELDIDLNLELVDSDEKITSSGIGSNGNVETKSSDITAVVIISGSENTETIDDELVMSLTNTQRVVRDMSQYTSRASDDYDSSEGEEEEVTDKDNDDEDYDENVETEFNPYVPLDENGTDNFNDEEEFTEFVDSSAFYSASAIYNPNDPISSITATTTSQDFTETTKHQDESEKSSPLETPSVNVNIKPLSKDKINLIKSTMLGLKITPRPMQDLSFNDLNLAKIRIGDEIKEDTLHSI